MQPEFISVTSMPASFMKPPSTPISPNSFSMRTSFSPAIGLRDQLFDERGLARAEETGKYINFCHTYNLFLLEAACFSNRIL